MLCITEIHIAMLLCILQSKAEAVCNMQIVRAQLHCRSEHLQKTMSALGSVNHTVYISEQTNTDLDKQFTLSATFFLETSNNLL